MDISTLAVDASDHGPDCQQPRLSTFSSTARGTRMRTGRGGPSSRVTRLRRPRTRPRSDDLIALIGAGHETTAAAITRGALLLAYDPEMQDRARAAVDADDNDYLAALAEEVLLAPSIVCDRADPWVTLMRRLALLPVLPISGSGRADFEPIWAADVARATIAAIDAEPGRYELAGPERLTYNEIARASSRERRLLHVPLPPARAGLIWLGRLAGERA